MFNTKLKKEIILLKVALAQANATIKMQAAEIKYYQAIMEQTNEAVQGAMDVNREVVELMEQRHEKYKQDIIKPHHN